MDLIKLKTLPENKIFSAGDVFVLFGELFGRGYVNGLIKQAKKHQMKIIGITVGRRDEQKNLRPLTPEELKESEQNLGGEIINIPLEAGFDLEKIGGETIVDIVNDIDKEDWINAKLEKEKILPYKKQGEQRFQEGVEKVMEILEQKIPSDKNIFFAHTMAGGFVRSKILFLIANKVFKGKGERYVSSEKFWYSDIGQLCNESFNSVTADTFDFLVRASQKIRERNEKQGKKVFYSSYGYHGTEILMGGEFRWQTYVPYQQGHAKKLLENYSKKFQQQNIQTTVFNCPEIRTDSSSIFLGVELPLFSLITALKKFHPSKWTEEKWNFFQSLLKDEVSLKDTLKELENYLLSSTIQESCVFEKWPTENNPELSDLMITTSEKISSLHKNKKDLITDYLSRIIIEVTGGLIFDYASIGKEPVVWLGHDIIVEKLKELYPE